MSLAGKISTFAIMAALAAVPASVSAAEPAQVMSPEEHIAAFEKLQRAGRYNEGDEHLEFCIVCREDSPPRADLLKDKAKLREAEPRISAEEAADYLRRGDFRCLYGDKDGGLEDYRKALSLAGDSEHRVEANRKVAALLLERGDVSGALQHANDALKIVRSDQTLWQRGECNFRAGNFKAALDDFRACTNKDADVGLYWDSVGKAHFELGNTSAALTAIERGLKCNMTTMKCESAYAEPLLYKAAAQLVLRRRDKAKETILWLLQSNGWKRDESPYAVALLADLERAGGKPERATAAVEAGRRRLGAPVPADSLGFIKNAKIRERVRRSI